MNRKMIRRRQRKIDSMFMIVIITNALIVFVLLLVNLGLRVSAVEKSENNEIEDVKEITTYESVTVEEEEIEAVDHSEVIMSANVLPQEEKETRWTDEEAYMLAKIAMAEAEGESLDTKVLIILTILNRVSSEKAYFPDTIEEVIFQNKDGVYQFSPIAPGGRWWTTEPNEECWEAVSIVSEMDYDISNGALYFEACKGESWHSRNLEFVCQSDNTRFYK